MRCRFERHGEPTETLADAFRGLAVRHKTPVEPEKVTAPDHRSSGAGYGNQKCDRARVLDFAQRKGRIAGRLHREP
jgi:hypothetical protein